MYLFNSLRVVGRLLAFASETALQRRQPVLVVLAHGLGVLGRADLGGLAGGEVVAQLDLGGGTLALDGGHGGLRDLALPPTDQGPARALDAAYRQELQNF